MKKFIEQHLWFRRRFSPFGRIRFVPVSHTPVPQAGCLADGQVPPPVLSFLNLEQVPVDHSAHIRYTDLAFSFASQTKNKAMSEVWKPFRAPNLARFYGLFLQRTLFHINKVSSVNRSLIVHYRQQFMFAYTARGISEKYHKKGGRVGHSLLAAPLSGTAKTDDQLVQRADIQLCQKHDMFQGWSPFSGLPSADGIARDRAATLLEQFRELFLSQVVSTAHNAQLLPGGHRVRAHQPGVCTGDGEFLHRESLLRRVVAQQVPNKMNSERQLGRRRLDSCG